MARRRRRRRNSEGAIASDGHPVTEAQLLRFPEWCACRLYYEALCEPIRRVTPPTACGQCPESPAPEVPRGSGAKPG